MDLKRLNRILDHLSIAACLLRKRSLGLAGDGLKAMGGLRAAERDQPIERFSVLSTDYTGVCTGAWLTASV